MVSERRGRLASSAKGLAARRVPSAGLSGAGPAAALVDQRQHRRSMACAGGRMPDRPFFHGLTEQLRAPCELPQSDER